MSQSHLLEDSEIRQVSVFAGCRSDLMHLLTAPLLIANCLVTSVLGQPVPSGTGGGQGPVEPRRGLVAKVFGGLRDLRAHAGHGVRKVPGVADLLYPESMIPGREVYYNLDLLPPTTGDRHSAKYKCVELCTGRQVRLRTHPHAPISDGEASEI